MKIYAVYDKKAMSFDSIISLENDVQASRSFDQAVNDPSTTLFKYPSDFALYYLGEYDSSSGAIISSDIPVLKHEAMEFVRKSAVGEGHEVSEPTTTLPAAGAEE
jgi:hypothetical protein